jgi:AcrR family transcriptional regulator
MTASANPESAKTEGAEPDRRQQIIAAAAEIFFDKGYERACIDDLIVKVGGSKRTIYNIFENKEGLFTAVVDSFLADYAKRIDAVSAADEGGADLRSSVLAFARASTSIVYAPPMLSLYRVLIGEGRRFPNLAKSFFERGASVVATVLTQILERHKARGELAIEDCRMAAEQLMGLVRDYQYLGVLLGVREPPPPEELERRVCALIDIFFDGVATHRRA